MVWLIHLVAHLSDFTILLTGAVSTAALALLLAWGGHYVLQGMGGNIEPRNALADVVHGSLLAFIVFVLAQIFASVHDNEGAAADGVLREAATVSRLSRELQTVDPGDQSGARAKLSAYVATVVKEDWPLLGSDSPRLAPAADQALDELVNRLQHLIASAPAHAVSLQTTAHDLDALRQNRLENATRTVPAVFWWVIAVFLIGAMLMNGRFKPTLGTNLVNAFHMGAIGMVIALIFILDEPYRGETAVSPAPLAKAGGIAKAGIPSPQPSH